MPSRGLHVMLLQPQQQPQPQQSTRRVGAVMALLAVLSLASTSTAAAVAAVGDSDAPPVCVGMTYPGMAMAAPCGALTQPGPFCRIACACSNTGNTSLAAQLSLDCTLSPQTDTISWTYVYAANTTQLSVLTKMVQGTGFTRLIKADITNNNTSQAFLTQQASPGLGISSAASITVPPKSGGVYMAGSVSCGVSMLDVTNDSNGNIAFTLQADGDFEGSWLRAHIMLKNYAQGDNAPFVDVRSDAPVWGQPAAPRVLLTLQRQCQPYNVSAQISLLIPELGQELFCPLYGASAFLYTRDKPAVPTIQSALGTVNNDGSVSLQVVWMPATDDGGCPDVNYTYSVLDVYTREQYGTGSLVPNGTDAQTAVWQLGGDVAGDSEVTIMVQARTEAGVARNESFHFTICRTPSNILLQNVTTSLNESSNDVAITILWQPPTDLGGCPPTYRFFLTANTEEQYGAVVVDSAVSPLVWKLNPQVPRGTNLRVGAVVHTVADETVVFSPFFQLGGHNEAGGSSGGLSGGAIAGIVVSLALVVAVASFLGYRWYQTQREYYTI
eukprot:m.83977 g.83977  ORF g.83977 m.83977 type:complete len:554 (-) comp15000_c0_seq2:124-1785(-)